MLLVLADNLLGEQGLAVGLQESHHKLGSEVEVLDTGSWSSATQVERAPHVHVTVL